MIKLISKSNEADNKIFIVNKLEDLPQFLFDDKEYSFIKSCADKKDELIYVNKYSSFIFIILVSNEKQFVTTEKLRCLGNDIYKHSQRYLLSSLTITFSISLSYSLAVAEGIALSSYKFNKYFSDKSKSENHLKDIFILEKDNNCQKDIAALNAVVESVFKARDIVNEPCSYMTAIKLSEIIDQYSKEYGFNLEVLHKQQIESLRMGGLLAVNRGSEEAPTFNILKWSPADALNTSPIVLVGKGIVFDTGGINLKPSGHLETMKSDKAGAAAVIGTIIAAAKSGLKLNIIGLIPATENRPGKNAYLPSDVVTMFDGTTVEVLNTDAEGRMILADALAYSKKFNPCLVIDIATLTGSAVVALGEQVSAIMGNNQDLVNDLVMSSSAVWERLHELPMWDDYADLLKSDIADLQNIGGKYAGTITAAKFLEHFTNYNWAHIDIAGPAFCEKETNYKGLGGTGVGVRLLYDYLSKYVYKYNVNNNHNDI